MIVLMGGYTTSPDYRIEADRGSSSAISVKQSVALAPTEHERRAEERAGARQWDAEVESGQVVPASGRAMSRVQKDRARAMPRATPADIPDPRMERRLPTPGAVRTPLSSRQQKDRSATKIRVQRAAPKAQVREVSRLVSDEDRWQHLNDQLSVNVSDAQQLENQDLDSVQRVDRAIQSYERENQRSHVVYTNVRMPRFINSSNVDGYVVNVFQPGKRIEFDRFTMGAQNLHEMDGVRAPAVVAFEIQTRRGAYLGRSDSIDDTSHFLPRGMSLEVVATEHATYRRPDGSEGRRLVVQLKEREDPS